jgi:hypothetical protein
MTTEMDGIAFFTKVAMNIWTGFSACLSEVGFEGRD